MIKTLSGDIIKILITYNFECNLDNEKIMLTLKSHFGIEVEFHINFKNDEDFIEKFCNYVSEFYDDDYARRLIIEGYDRKTVLEIALGAKDLENILEDTANTLRKL